jgi:hypothetical protein
MDRKPVAYLAGPVTGRPRRNLWAFLTYQEYLERQGRQVVNPLRLVRPSATWLGAMVRCLWHVALCDELWLLPGWERSRGARLELRYARALGVRVREVPVLH